MSALTRLGVSAYQAPAGGNTLNPTNGSPGMKSPSITLSGGNLTATGGSGGGNVLSLLALASGTKSFSATVVATSGTVLWIGLATAAHSTNNGDYAGSDAFASGVYDGGQKYESGASVGGDPNIAFPNPGDVIVFSVNMTTRVATVTVNGGTPGTLNLPATGDLYAVVGCDSAGAAATVNLSSYP